MSSGAWIVGPVGLFCFSMWAMIGYFELQRRTHTQNGKESFKVVFKKNVSFDNAFQAFSEGKPIRRKSSSKGFVKQTRTSGNHKKEVFGHYRTDARDWFIEGAVFSVEDIFAEDWIIDE